MCSPARSYPAEITGLGFVSLIGNLVLFYALTLRRVATEVFHAIAPKVDNCFEDVYKGKAQLVVITARNAARVAIKECQTAPDFRQHIFKSFRGRGMIFTKLDVVRSIFSKEIGPSM
jgi:hypothetical protein